MSKILVGVIMGSKSDWSGTMEHCSSTLKQFGVKDVHEAYESSELALADTVLSLI